MGQQKGHPDFGWGFDKYYNTYKCATFSAKGCSKTHAYGTGDLNIYHRPDQSTTTKAGSVMAQTPAAPAACTRGIKWCKTTAGGTSADLGAGNCCSDYGCSLDDVRKMPLGSGSSSGNRRPVCWNPTHTQVGSVDQCKIAPAIQFGNKIACKNSATTTMMSTPTTTTLAVNTEYNHHPKGCVYGHNIKLYHGKTVQECKSICDQTAGCVAFEYGVAYGGPGGYKPAQCQPQSSANKAACPGAYFRSARIHCAAWQQAVCVLNRHACTCIRIWIGEHTAVHAQPC